jgi:hypothetical protein
MTGSFSLKNGETYRSIAIGRGRSLCLPWCLIFSVRLLIIRENFFFLVCPGFQENPDYLGDVSDCMVSGKDYFVYVLCVSLGF